MNINTANSSKICGHIKENNQTMSHANRMKLNSEILYKQRKLTLFQNFKQLHTIDYLLCTTNLFALKLIVDVLFNCINTKLFRNIR